MPPTPEKKAIDSREWYDFVGILSGVLPAIHMGGEAATDQLLDMLLLTEKSTVLDVGCGAGATACRIVERSGAHVTGVDLSPVMIDKAQARARRAGVSGQTSFRTGDVLALPFPDGAFDVVLLDQDSIHIPLQFEGISVQVAHRRGQRRVRPIERSGFQIRVGRAREGGGCVRGGRHARV